jgi:ATP-dependent Clp protease ATP-binding subunit ClpA
MGPFDRFNDRAKRVLALAQDEAIRFNHNYIGTEHLLMGLVREGEGVAARVLDSLGVELSKVRTAIEFTIGRGDEKTSPSQIRLNPQMKKAIELAADEARTLGHSHVGTEHLLLGIVRQNESIGAKVLGGLGVDLERVRRQVIATLGQQHPGVATGSSNVVSHSTGEFAGGRTGGPFDRFTDRAKRVLALAQDEAIRFNHNYIGTEHLLLGLLREEEGVAARALQTLGAELEKARQAVVFIIGRGDAAASPSEITLSPRTKKVIELAIDEARRLGTKSVGTEHMLLGLAREGEGIASGILESLGITMEKVRHAVIQTLGQMKPDTFTQVKPDLPTNVYSNTLVQTGPFDLLDDAAKRVLGLAEEEARQMRHNWIGTEHMMIALLRSDGVAQRALQELGVTLDQARAGVFKAVPPRETDVTEITVTPRVKTLLGKAITLAAPTADRVKPQHLLLALVADPDGVGSQVLAELGVTPEKLRVTVDRLSAG